MRVPIYQVDAFASRRFEGNPAAVMLLSDFLEDAVLQAIAAENNLAETAFVTARGDQYRLRWFTPVVEVPLCGHATLASAAVIFERLGAARTAIVFQTASGALTVSRAGRGYVMDFPARPTTPPNAIPNLAPSLGVEPIDIVWDGFNYVARLESAARVRGLKADHARMLELDCDGVIVTASGDQGFDFVSRYFAPAKGIPEDPVTGGAHCALAPYWSEHLGKTDFRAFQASARGGEIKCRLRGDRVELEGECVFFLEGEAEI